jgi:hypothetical protein
VKYDIRDILQVSIVLQRSLLCGIKLIRCQFRDGQLLSRAIIISPPFHPFAIQTAWSCKSAACHNADRPITDHLVASDVWTKQNRTWKRVSPAEANHPSYPFLPAVMWWDSRLSSIAQYLLVMCNDFQGPYNMTSQSSRYKCVLKPGYTVIRLCDVEKQHGGRKDNTIILTNRQLTISTTSGEAHV